MTASFPGSVKSFGTDLINGDYLQAAHVNDLRAEVVAVETALITDGVYIPPRVDSTTSETSVTPDATVDELYAWTALAAGITINAPTNAADGQRLVFRFKDNGTSRAITWNAIFRAIGVTMPTATTINKTLYVGAIYNSSATKWDVIGVALEA